MAAGRRSSPLDALALFAFLLGFWLLLSGRYEPKDLLFGAASAGLVTLATHERLFRSGRPANGLGFALRRIAPLRLARFLLWLLRAIVEANLQVAWVVLHPRMPVAPSLVRFRVDFEGRLPQVVLAHSITLTPGTVTIDLGEGRYLVHSLLPASAEALRSGEMQRGVALAFRERSEGPPRVETLGSIHATGLVRERGAR